MKSVWDYRDYKKYLDDFVDEKSPAVKRTRTALARIAHCQTGYITQVLSGSAHLSLEQAERINGYCMHSEEESEFFLLLVQFARAGTPDLKKRLQKQINRWAEEQASLGKRIAASDGVLSESAKQVYFSQWHFAVVHALLTIPEYRTREAIAARLAMKPNRVVEVLEFLERHGLATRKGARYIPGNIRIHLEPGSTVLARHYFNVRLLALESLSGDLRDDTHYSSIVTLSDEDMVRIKKLIGDFIVEMKTRIRTTVPAGLHAFNLDFFRL